MKIINIVDEVSDLNHGIWHAAVVNAALLRSRGFTVELWYPASDKTIPPEVEAIPLNDTTLNTLSGLIQRRRLNPATDVVITHGVWQFPTRWGHQLKRLGFRWVYVPQGMLEPWPLKQKWLKKKLYFFFAEKKMAKKADLIRAVSKPESLNLRKFFPASRIEFIPNGVTTVVSSTAPKRTGVTNYLFLSRLHHKKNILVLAEAWINSNLNNDPARKLIVAGPDQGELEKLREIMKRSANIDYVGTVSGSDKIDLLAESDFFVLPSFSEGLPSALLEAMGAGLVPIISSGCNLPDVFERKLGFEVSTDQESVVKGLETSTTLQQSQLDQLKMENAKFIREQFSVESITDMQELLYLGNPTAANTH